MISNVMMRSRSLATSSSNTLETNILKLIFIKETIIFRYTSFVFWKALDAAEYHQGFFLP